MKYQLTNRLYFSIAIALICCSLNLAQAQNPADTFDPEQRLPVGAVLPIPKRIPATATTEKFEARVDPPNWWVGFKEKTVELMVHDRNIGAFKPDFSFKGVRILKTESVENANYLFVTLSISDTAQLGNLVLSFNNGTEKRTFNWKLDKRNKSADRNQGISESDFVYLIMPDRFANGDTTNDSFSDMRQTGVDRRKMYFRHGGDLKGIENHIDYLKNLGVTALWLTPMQENNQVAESYHGYAVTDWYKIDKRFGTLSDYKSLVTALHQQKMKMVLDVVPNHSGNENYYIKDLPETNWIHQIDSFQHPNYREQVLFDPYASKSDFNTNENNWFDRTMPDMNPEGNPHLARYIVQNHLWWLEETGVDAFRIDTYFYNDQKFMGEWAAKLRAEFPKLFLFGENSVHSALNQAFFEERFPKKDFNSNMQASTDYSMFYAMRDAFTNSNSWDHGIISLYSTLGQDVIYKKASNNVVFFDNHDQGRFYSILNENLGKYKSAIAFLLTTRGVPQWYYGAELGFTGFTNPDGKVRQDMPGGWAEDKVSVFKASDRTPLQTDLYNYTAQLANWRKSKSFVQTGKLTHFIPEDGVYVYFREDATGAAMVIINGNNSDKTLKTKRFSENLSGYKTFQNIITGASIENSETLSVAQNGVIVIEMHK